MRPQFNNNNKNRNRNRNRRPNGGGGGQSGGNGANRVYDSNGPDVKLRGTAQTIAEKYMQLARDAHSGGDSVAAESYYQFADHYYRVWLAAQPAGQPIQFSRRLAEEEYDEDGNETVPESEAAEGETGETAETTDATATSENGEQQAEGENPQQRQNFRNDRNDRNFNRDNRDGQNNNRNFRQRWPRRNDRYNQDGQNNGQQGYEAQNDGGERQDPVEQAVEAPRAVETQDNGNWEAPSFLTRPVPVAENDAVGEEAPAPRPRRGRPPRVATPVEDAPQGE